MTGSLCTVWQELSVLCFAKRNQLVIFQAHERIPLEGPQFGLRDSNPFVNGSEAPARIMCYKS